MADFAASLSVFVCPKIFEDGKSVEQVFFKLDLISVGIEEVCSSQKDPNFFIPFIRYVASSQAAFVDHFNYYRCLSRRSDLEKLREAYCRELNPHISEHEKIMLLDCPNRSGLRLSFKSNELVLKNKILAISSINFHHVRGIPQVKMISSAGIRFLKPNLISEILDEERSSKKFISWKRAQSDECARASF